MHSFSALIMKLFVYGILAMICDLATSAPPNWDPESDNTTPFDSLDSDLMKSDSILYLDDDCNVVALISAESATVQGFIPKANDIRSNWMYRKTQYEHAAICPNGDITFLDAKIIPGTGIKEACKPNSLVNPNDLKGAQCIIKRNKITSLIVLDKDLEPLVIVDGDFAKNSAIEKVPAAYLGRSNFYPGTRPCSPTTPSPCPNGTSGATKYINGRQVCMCQ